VETMEPQGLEGASLPMGVPGAEPQPPVKMFDLITGDA